jgi:hypothetical protein
VEHGFAAHRVENAVEQGKEAIALVRHDIELNQVR